MIMKKAIKESIEKWTKHLDNENFGELIRAIMYYEKNKNIENMEGGCGKEWIRAGKSGNYHKGG